MLTGPSLLINYLLFSFNINLTLFRVVILFALIIIAATSIERKPYSIFAKHSMLFFTIGILLLFFGLSVNLFGPGTIYIVRTIILFPLFVIIMKSKKFNLSNFINYYLKVVFVLALLSIVQYFATPFGLVPFRALNSNPEPVMVGFGGVRWVIEERAKSLIPRNVGFFTEPTNFGQMLMIPLFLSAYKTLQSKKIKDLVRLITIASAFALTFSVANIFGLFSGIILYYYLKLKSPNFNTNRKVFKKALNVCVLMLIIYGGYSFFQLTNDNIYNSEVMVGKNTIVSVINRIDRILIYLANVKENPFGNWSFKNEYHSNPGFIGTVLLAGGFPFLVFWIFFLLYFFRRLYKTAAKSQYLLIYCGMFAFSLPMLWDVQFYEAQFLFYLAFFIVLVKYDVGVRFVFSNNNRKGYLR